MSDFEVTEQTLRSGNVFPSMNRTSIVYKKSVGFIHRICFLFQRMELEIGLRTFPPPTWTTYCDYYATTMHYFLNNSYPPPSEAQRLHWFTDHACNLHVWCLNNDSSFSRKTSNFKRVWNKDHNWAELWLNKSWFFLINFDRSVYKIAWKNWNS